MDEALALHTAARRYCLERDAFWRDRYEEITRRGDRERDGYHYTPEALNTFPRYNLLNAIRVELERIHPDTLGVFEDTKTRLTLVGQTAEDDFTQRPIGTIDQQAIADEREAFCLYIGNLSPSDVSEIDPLPYRRVLATEESSWLRSRLNERWQVSADYWYPLSECSLPGIVAFEDRAFSEAVSPDCLRAILGRRGIARVWELREYGPEYEEDVSLFAPYYNGAEGYWSSGDLDWIVYASHEQSVTVGGWLLEEVKAVWSSWQDQIWTGQF